MEDMYYVLYSVSKIYTSNTTKTHQISEFPFQAIHIILFAMSNCIDILD